MSSDQTGPPRADEGNNASDTTGPPPTAGRAAVQGAGTNAAPLPLTPQSANDGVLAPKAPLARPKPRSRREETPSKKIQCAQCKHQIRVQDERGERPCPGCGKMIRWKITPAAMPAHETSPLPAVAKVAPPPAAPAEPAEKGTNEDSPPIALLKEKPKEPLPSAKRRPNPLLVVGGVLFFLAVVQAVLLASLVFGKNDPPLREGPQAASLSDVKEALRNHHGELARLAEQQEKTFRAELGKLRPANGATPPPADMKSLYERARRPLDVMVLALNTRHLPLARYKEAFEGLFELYEAEKPFWSPRGTYRLGFYVAQTEQVDARVSLETQEVDILSFNIRSPGIDIIERLATIGPAVVDKFSKDRPNRRVVVVASSRCPPPDVNAPGWKELPAVDAILVAQSADTPPPEPRHLQAWKAFCQQKRGEAFFLASRSNAAGPDPATARELGLLLASLVNPYRAYPPPKK